MGCGTSPNKAHSFGEDLNSNGLRDAGESEYRISPYKFSAPDVDHDGDGLTSLDEQNIHLTNIFNPDTDGDLLPDGWEKDHGLDPNNPDTDNDGTPDSEEDSDNDGADNLLEFSFTTDPNDSDTDDDGETDGSEINGPDSNPNTPDGTDPNFQGTNGEADIPAEEKVSILLGVGDESGSDSEDYIMRIFRINPDTGDEEPFHVLRSGGHGKYKERTLGIFRKSDTYTFQIDWQSTNNKKEGNDPNNNEGPDYDYTFKVEPQGQSSQILFDSYDPITERVNTNKSILGSKLNDVVDFDTITEPLRVLYMAINLKVTDKETSSDLLPYFAESILHEGDNASLCLSAAFENDEAEIEVETPGVPRTLQKSLLEWILIDTISGQIVDNGNFKQSENPSSTLRFPSDSSLHGYVTYSLVLSLRDGNGVSSAVDMEISIKMTRDRLLWAFDPLDAQMKWTISRPEPRVDTGDYQEVKENGYDSEGLQSVYRFLRNSISYGNNTTKN